MRVVAGEFRGRSIAAPKGKHTRPTVDRVREALMSSLYSIMGGFDGMRVLDAFAGSGALGIEALSRGAAYADFFEKDRESARVIESNLKACGLGKERARVRQIDVLKALDPESASFIGDSSKPYDLVFLDPPYSYGVESTKCFIDQLVMGKQLSNDAVIAYEFAQKDAVELQDIIDSAWIVGQKKYGKTGVAILRPTERGAE